MIEFGPSAMSKAVLKRMYHFATRKKIENDVNVESLGLKKVSHEYTEGDVSQKMVEFLFKYTGVTLMDVGTKNVLASAAIERTTRDMYDLGATKGSRTERNARLRLEQGLRVAFGKDKAVHEKFFEELKTKKYGDLTRQFVLSKIARYFPTTKSNAPMASITGGTALKLFYQFKSFPLKFLNMWMEQVNTSRNASKEKYALAKEFSNSSDPLKRAEAVELEKDAKMLKNDAVLKAVLIPVSTIAANMAATLVINELYNRKGTETWKGMFTSEIGSLIGISRMAMYDAGTGSLRRAIGSTVLPGASIVDTMVMDLQKWIKSNAKNEDFTWKDKGSVSFLPLLGAFFYSWGGLGAKNAEKHRRENN
jgi:hypothetical protein